MAATATEVNTAVTAGDIGAMATAVMTSPRPVSARPPPMERTATTAAVVARTATTTRTTVAACPTERSHYRPTGVTALA